MLRIGIALGDATGIGPEVSIKALATLAPEVDARYVLIGDRVIIEQQARIVGFDLSNSVSEILQPTPGLPSTALSLSHPKAAQAAIEWLREGAHLCLSGALDALVTAPVNKA